MSKSTESRKLMCQLSEHELLERGNEMAKTYMQVAALDLQKKRITSQIKPLDERIEALVVIIDTKEEERSTECRWVFDWALGVKRLYRTDTGLELDSREIRSHERQQQFELESAEDAEDLGPDPDNVCFNTGCLQYEENTPNHCRRLEYTSECDNPKGTGAPKEETTDAEPETEEEPEGSEAGNEVAGSAAGAGALGQVADPCAVCRSDRPDCDEQCCNPCEKNHLCPHVQFCTLTEHDSICAVCIGECGDYTPGTAVSECPGFLAKMQSQSEDKLRAQISVEVLLAAGFSRNAAKILMAGFTLVSYDREAKTIHVTAPDLRKGWVAFDPFTTYAQAERALDKMLEDPGVVGIARNKKGSITQAAKHLHDFTFYRSEGIIAGHGTPRIKKGPNWTTWKKFDTAEECAAAWENLLTNDPKALED